MLQHDRPNPKSAEQEHAEHAAAPHRVQLFHYNPNLCTTSNPAADGGRPTLNVRQETNQAVTMKSVTNTIMLIVLPLILTMTSCVTVDGTGAGKPLYGYELGKAKGYQDGHGGLSRAPSRHEVSDSGADRAEFFRGYEDGYNQGIKPGASAPAVEEKSASGQVPQKVINDCIDALEKQIPDRDIMLITARRGEASYIVDLAVRGVAKPWRCYHDGTRCTGTEYQGEG